MGGKTVELEFIVQTVAIVCPAHSSMARIPKSVHHADGIPVWLLFLVHRMFFEMVYQDQEPIVLQMRVACRKGAASSALHCLRRRSTIIILVVWVNVRHKYNNNTLSATRQGILHITCHENIRGCLILSEGLIGLLFRGPPRHTWRRGTAK